MGTLFKQNPRNELQVKASDLDGFLSSVVNLSQKHKISFTDVISASRVLELKRRNDLFVSNGDTFDEQIAGMGEILEKLSNAVESLKSTE